MVEGESGLLAIHPKHERPRYEPSNRRLIWPNGAVGHTYNATEPDQLRGPQHDLAWSDELAKWAKARETWDQLQFGLRKGPNPQQVITTTPRPIKILKDIIAGKEGEVVITHGHTLDNKDNLSARFLRKVQRKYEGTRLGRQELAGTLLSDAPNALWTQANIDENRLSNIPAKLGRIVVAVDPPAKDGTSSRRTTTPDGAELRSTPSVRMANWVSSSRMVRYKARRAAGVGGWYRYTTSTRPTLSWRKSIMAGPWSRRRYARYGPLFGSLRLRRRGASTCVRSQYPRYTNRTESRMWARFLNSKTR